MGSRHHGPTTQDVVARELEVEIKIVWCPRSNQRFRAPVARVADYQRFDHIVVLVVKREGAGEIAAALISVESKMGGGEIDGLSKRRIPGDLVKQILLQPSRNDSEIGTIGVNAVPLEPAGGLPAHDCIALYRDSRQFWCIGVQQADTVVAAMKLPTQVEDVLHGRSLGGDRQTRGTVVVLALRAGDGGAEARLAGLGATFAVLGVAILIVAARGSEIDFVGQTNTIVTCVGIVTIVE